MRYSILSLLLLLLTLNVSAQVLRYKVVENVVSAEEFRRAYCARDAYNYTRNLDISEEEKSLIIEQVISTFSSEEQEFYEPTEYGSDLHIINIGKYPNGLYAADILSYHHHTQFLSSDFVPFADRAVMAYAATFSTDGVYVGCEIYDCDPRVQLTFYSVNSDNTLTKVAEYENSNVRLLYIEYEDQSRLSFPNEYMQVPMFWNNGALYYIAVSDDRNSVVYNSLDLVEQISN